jgi:hypothetical protein
MYDLMNEDLSIFSTRNKPHSPFGADMKIRTSDTTTRWLYECLNANAYADQYGISHQLFVINGTSCTPLKDNLFGSYQHWCKTSPERYPMTRDQFFKRLRELLGSSITDTRPSAPSGQTRERKIVMSGLVVCRSEFEAAAGILGGVTWEEI